MGNSIKFIDSSGFAGFAFDENGNVIYYEYEYNVYAPYGRFDTIDKAAENFGLEYNDDSFEKGEEVAACIYEGVRDNGAVFYYYDHPRNELDTHIDREISFYVSWTDKSPVALIHTHGRFDANTENYKDVFSHPGNVISGNDEFSDTYQSDAIGIDYYLVTPTGELKKYISNSGNVEGVLISSNMPVDPRIKVYEINYDTSFWHEITTNHPTWENNQVVEYIYTLK